MTKDEAYAQIGGKPIFEIEPDTEVRQVWFVSSNQRDVLGMLYKDEQGWVLKYRFRHYAEALSAWDPPDEGKRTAFDGRDQKKLYTMRPPADHEVTEEDLEITCQQMTKAMEQLAEKMREEYDPSAALWTRKVSTGTELITILQNAPWAHAKTIKAPDSAVIVEDGDE